MEDKHLHYVGKVAQKALIKKDGAFLVVRGPYDRAWDIPGGRLHKGEQPSDGLKREIREELGVDIRVGRPFFTEVVTGMVDGEERYFIVFETEMENPNAEFTYQLDEIDRIQWVRPEEIENFDMYPVCREALRKYRDQVLTK